MARVSAEPCALASHGSALGCQGCRQHCLVPRAVRLHLPSTGFCPSRAHACSHNRPEIQRCSPKSKKPSHQGVCLLWERHPRLVKMLFWGQETTAWRPFTPRWERICYSEIRKCLGEGLTALTDIMVTPLPSTSVLWPVPWVVQAAKPFSTSCLSCMGAAVEAPVVQADPADLIRTQLRSKSAFTFFMLTTA